MQASRFVAVGLVAVAALWIGSGYIFGTHETESEAAIRAPDAVHKPFRVAIIDTQQVAHSRTLTLSGRTKNRQAIMPGGIGDLDMGGRVTRYPMSSSEKVKEGGNVAVMGGSNLQTLVGGLNRMGLKPNSIIAILQAIKSAGALQADLVVQ